MWVIYARDAWNSKWKEEPDLGEKHVELLFGYLESDVFVPSAHAPLLFASLAVNNVLSLSSSDVYVGQVHTLLSLTAVFFPLFLTNLSVTYHWVAIQYLLSLYVLPCFSS